MNMLVLKPVYSLEACITLVCVLQACKPLANIILQAAHHNLAALLEFLFLKRGGSVVR